MVKGLIELQDIYESGKEAKLIGHDFKLKLMVRR